MLDNKSYTFINISYHVQDTETVQTLVSWVEEAAMLRAAVTRGDEGQSSPCDSFKE